MPKSLIFGLFYWIDFIKRTTEGLFDTPETPRRYQLWHFIGTVIILGLWGVKKALNSQFNKIGQKWGFLAFLRIFCILIFDWYKRHKGLVSVIKQNGHMLPLSWCARNKNSTLFLYQTRWLFFSLFLGHPVCHMSYRWSNLEGA